MSRQCGGIAGGLRSLLHYQLLPESLRFLVDNAFSPPVAVQRLAKPSFILFRGDVERRPEVQASLLLGILSARAEHLERGGRNASM
jgi:hypothetical protein